jgi:hypothetical protein
MAFRYCYSALASVGTTSADAALQTLFAGMTNELRQDLKEYDDFFSKHQDDAATELANNANDAYIKASGDEEGVGRRIHPAYEASSVREEETADTGGTRRFCDGCDRSAGDRPAPLQSRYMHLLN